ncbi:MAG: Fe-S cluster assembly protein SufD [Bosea sp. (in: a-proteobacteria)]
MTANANSVKTAAEQALALAFDTHKASLPGQAELREQAFAQIAEDGLPHRRVEAWKYTDWRALMREAAPLAAKPSEAVAKAALKSAFPVKGCEISFVDGHHQATSKLPKGVTCTSLASALASGHADLAHLGALAITKGDVGLALNAAFMSDGAVLRVAAGVAVEEPIILRFVTTGEKAAATALRSLVVVEEGASVTLVESHEFVHDAGHQPNTALEIIVADKAEVAHLRLTGLGEKGLGLSTMTADLGHEASLNALNVAITGGAQRHQMFVRFSGKDARAQINGLTVLRDRQHADHTLVVDHAGTGGTSRELFRTVLDDQSTGVFQGKIIVRQEAQQTDGRMASNCVMLHDGPVMNNKPELEIFADDVACAHGATCGALDDDLLFYLMARGIGRREAENLMVESFLGETADAIAHEGLRDIVLAQVAHWLDVRADEGAGA